MEDNQERKHQPFLKKIMEHNNKMIFEKNYNRK